MASTNNRQSRKHGRGKSHLRAARALFLASIAAPWPALANPGGEQVRTGAANFNRRGSTLTIHQQTDRAIIDWQHFSIGKGELTRFVQPKASSAVLNRVVSGNPSAILGRLEANGQVYLINPNGVLVGPGATIRTQSFVASTLDVSDHAFMAGGDLTFRGSSDATILNQGSITALGGDVFLIARTVENAGTIKAAKGVTGLAAGAEVLLKRAGDQRLFVRAGSGSAEAGVTNSGVIESAQAELRAAGSNVYALAINNTGVVRATGVDRSGGRIRLTAEGGRVRVSGKLDARNARGEGGTIHVSGGQIQLEGAALDVSGITGGGEIRVGGDFRGQGDLPTAENAAVDAASMLRADATGAGDGGSIVVWSDGNTAFHGTISARGAGDAGRGGDAEVSGKEHLLVSGHADLRGPASAGMFLLDPGSVSIVDGTDGPSGAMDTFTDGWINTQLAASSLTITTASSTNGQTENLTVENGAAVSWSSGNTLSLEAGNNITMQGSITSTGAGALILRADTNADGLGAVTFSGGSVTASGGGNVNIYYNPAVYTSPTNYAGNVTVSGGGALTAYMLVNDVDQLQAMGTNLAGTYALNTDIDASDTRNWNAGVGFVPIGANAPNFTGVFDGQGHTITGLFINRTTGTNDTGLFGVVGASGVVRNVGLEEAEVRGNARTGVLIGSLSGGSVSNAYATGSVVSNNNVGGLIGIIGSGGAVSTSYADVSVTMTVFPLTTYAGGLVGRLTAGTIENSYAIGSVSGGGNSSGIGGLVGFISSSGGTIRNSYASGPVSGTGNVGGLVGSNTGGTVTNSFWDTDTTGRATSAGGTGRTTVQSDDQATYTGWDFTDTWFIINNQIRPMLRMEHSTTIRNAHQLQAMAMDLDATYTLPANLDLSTAGLTNLAGIWTGRGIAPVGNGGTPFVGVFDGGGHTIDGLFSHRNSGGADNAAGLFGRLGAGGEVRNVGLVNVDILGGVSGPLVVINAGGTISNCYVTGVVNGTNSTGGLVATLSSGTVTGSYSTATVTGVFAAGGLIGSKTGGSVSDSYATGAVISFANTGGLIGLHTGGTVSNSHATGSVAGSGSQQIRIGGLIGWFDGGTISDSYATGSVSGLTGVGGLVGLAQAGTISNAYATGTVNGANEVGGLVGEARITISNSYATGAVTGTGSNTGGLVGLATSTGTIERSYARGAVIGVGAVGGLVGRNDGTISDAYAIGVVTGVSNAGGLVGANGGTVTDSFWDLGTTGQSTSSGGTGKTTAELMDPTTFTDAGWDLTTVWAVVDGETYPYFQWRYPTGVQAVWGTVDGAGAGQDVTFVAGGAELAGVKTFANGFYYHLLEPGTVGAGSGLLTYGGGGNAFAMSNGSTANLIGLNLAANRLLINSPLAAASNATLAAAKGGLSNPEILYSVTGGNLALASGVGFVLPSGSSYTFDGNLTTDADITLDGTATATASVIFSGNNISIGGSLTGSDPSASLTLHANDSITLGADAAITTQGGNVTLHSDHDASGTGSIALNSGSSITTNGGDLTLTAGDDILMDGTASTAGGALTAHANNAITLGADAAITTQGGNVTLHSDHDASGTGSMAINSGSSIATNGGDLTLTAGDDILIDSAISTAGGALTATAGRHLTVNQTVDAGDGDVHFNIGTAIAGTLVLDGEVITTGEFAITGGSGNDTFNINMLVSNLTLHSGDGDDIVNTKLFATAAQTLWGGPHGSGDTLNIDGLGATIDGEDSPITGNGFATLAYSEFENVNVLNVIIDEVDPPPPDEYEVINDTTAPQLIERRRNGQKRNLTDEMHDATDAPSPVADPNTKRKRVSFIMDYVGLVFDHSHGQWRLKGRDQEQRQEILAEFSSFDLLDALELESSPTAIQE